MALSVLGFSIPVFVLGYLLIYLLRDAARLAAGAGLRQFLARVCGRWLEHLILPTLTLSVIYIALIARITRASVLEVLGEDYIRTAHAKGVGERAVLIHHALRNAAVPIVTVIGIGIALLISGVVVTESVFNLPGPRPPDRRCGAGARLSRHPGRDPSLLGRLHPGQSGGRRRATRSRPEDPLLSATGRALHRALRRGSGSPDVRRARALWRNPGVVFGLAVLLDHPAARDRRRLSCACDPVLLRPRFRLRAPSAIALARHRSASAATSTAASLYGARVSLFIGFAVATSLSSPASPSALSPVICALLDAILMRVMDGRDGDPEHSARDRDGRPLRRRHSDRDRRHRHSRDPTRRPACTQRRASVREEPYVEAAIGVGTPSAADHVAPHPAEHARAADRPGALTSAPRRSSPKRLWASSAPAFRPKSRAGATSWPKAANLPDRALGDPVSRHLRRADGLAVNFSATGFATCSIRASRVAWTICGERSTRSRHSGPRASLCRAAPSAASRRRGNLSLQVRPQEIVCIVGESGSGSR